MKVPADNVTKVSLITATVLYALFVPLWGEVAIFSWMLLDSGIALPVFFLYLLLFRLPNLVALPLLMPAWYYFAKGNLKRAWLLTFISLVILGLFVAYLLFDRYVIPRLVVS